MLISVDSSFYVSKDNSTLHHDQSDYGEEDIQFRGSALSPNASTSIEPFLKNNLIVGLQNDKSKYSITLSILTITIVLLFVAYIFFFMKNKSKLLSLSSYRRISQQDRKPVFEEPETTSNESQNMISTEFIETIQHSANFRKEQSIIIVTDNQPKNSLETQLVPAALSKSGSEGDYLDTLSAQPEKLASSHGSGVDDGTNLNRSLNPPTNHDNSASNQQDDEVSRYLSERSISNTIQLMKYLAKGRYGAVYLGKCEGTEVAVKIFALGAEEDWIREISIYSTPLLQHENVLGFIGADKQVEEYPGLWLVFDYHPNGSLHEFLQTKSFLVLDLYKMAYSIIQGLVHLHTEIHGSQGKPSIVHRDIKSANILVRNGGTGVISDLGFAVRHSANSGFVETPSHHRVGTRRYLAPELLDESMNLWDIEALKATDVYALSLVFWELLRRTSAPSPRFPNEPEFEIDGNGQPQRELVKGLKTVSVVIFNSGDPTQNKDDNTDMVTKSDKLEGSDGSNDPITHFPTTPQVVSYELTPATCRSPIPVPQSSEERASDEPQKYILPAMFQTGFSWDDILTNRDHPSNQICDTYELPFENYIYRDQPVEETRQLICVQKERPPISLRWKENRPMVDFLLLIQECWYDEASARLTALKIRKRLNILAARHFGGPFNPDENSEW